MARAELLEATAFDPAIARVSDEAGGVVCRACLTPVRGRAAVWLGRPGFAAPAVCVCLPCLTLACGVAVGPPPTFAEATLERITAARSRRRR